MRVTFDSNVLVHAVDTNAGTRHPEASDLIHRAAGRDCVLLLQSLGEFFHVATRKMKMAPDKVEFALARWRSVFPVHAVSERALDTAIGIVKRHGITFWDAMMWATAREAGCRFLLSEDLHDGQTIGGVRIVNPFARKNAVLMDAILPPV